jgi:hypothetical protein
MRLLRLEEETGHAEAHATRISVFVAGVWIFDDGSGDADQPFRADSHD